MADSEDWYMDMRPSDNLERMRSLLTRMERAVDSARDRRQGVAPSTGIPAPSTDAATPIPRTAPSMEYRAAVNAPAPLPFPAGVPSGKPRARAKSLEEFDEAFKRLADRRAS